jgi:hypothetical protein
MLEINTFTTISLSSADNGRLSPLSEFNGGNVAKFEKKFRFTGQRIWETSESEPTPQRKTTASCTAHFSAQLTLAGDDRVGSALNDKCSN